MKAFDSPGFRRATRRFRRRGRRRTPHAAIAHPANGRKRACRGMLHRLDRFLTHSGAA